MLTSLQNPLVKDLRKLHQAKHRHRQRQFLLEGTHLIQEALATNYPLEIICCTPQWQQKYSQQLWKELEERVNRLEIVSEAVLGAIATTVSPDGIIGVAPSPESAPLDLTSLGLALIGLQDPGNMGTIIRTATATQVEGLLGDDQCVDFEHPKVLRASAGQWFRLPMQRSDHLKAELEGYQKKGWQLIATSPHSYDPYWDANFLLPTIILMGSEGQGLPADIFALANQTVSIPQATAVESLNVAIATALLLYEVRRQRWQRP
ncbi:RNA methyltransferase [Candidatus Synechococcus calcipolaris G9]|uniref:RNA methyltransferase n=1 Tax=Candidatus Synechococcus calcipolaris G9 TaxID=1497997 RepID=A0ABT6F2U9_9SYNE|nr:RNA methyltransferase [Candidatus Synechococcus calcipolaris]MDG2992129.1 RNA methyltransferase [Candidatus Synechococcus calcipolaris G9]